VGISTRIRIHVPRIVPRCVCVSITHSLTHGCGRTSASAGCGKTRCLLVRVRSVVLKSFSTDDSFVKTW